MLAELKKRPEGSHIVLDTETTGLDMFGLADRYATPMGKPGGPKGVLVDPEFGPARICGMALGWTIKGGMHTVYLPYRHETREKQLPVDTIHEIVEAIESRSMTWVNHNIKFDAKMLWAEGCMPTEGKVKLEDTMLLAHILDERLESYALEPLVAFYTDYKMKFKGWVQSEFKKRHLRRYSQFTVAELGPYAEDDVRGTWKLRQSTHPHLLDPNAPYFGGHDLLKVFREEMEVLWVTTGMEIRGMRIDMNRCQELRDEWNAKRNEAVLDIQSFVGEAFAGFNPFSFKQIHAFFEACGWPIPIDSLRDSETFQDISLYKALPSGPNKEPLEHPDHPGMKDFIHLLVKARSLHKSEVYFDSYLRLADREGFVHPSFNQQGTVTGRLSSSQPNFQNVPKAIATGRTAVQKAAEEITWSPVRQVVIPRSPAHRLVDMDYSQQEIRMFLHYVDEPKMREIVKHACGDPDCDHEEGDIHHYAAYQMFGGMPDKKKAPEEYKRKRHMAKFINFGIIYGMGRRKLGDMFELSPSEADAYYRGYLDAFPHIKEFIEIVRGVADHRKWVKNAFGRRRRMRLLTDEEKRTGKIKTGLGYTASVRPDDETADAFKALNAIIQGGSADLVKRSMVRAHNLLRGTQSYLVNTIHDDLVFEIHEDEMDLIPKLREVMTNWPAFAVPFKVDVMIAQGDWSTSEASRV